MTTFNDKEKAAENKYAHDKEMEFKALARRNKLLGVWAAAKMALSAPMAEEYAKSLVALDTEKHSEEGLFNKIKKDFVAKGVTATDHDIHEQMHTLLQAARAQVNG